MFIYGIHGESGSPAQIAYQITLERMTERRNLRSPILFWADGDEPVRSAFLTVNIVLAEGQLERSHVENN